MQKKKNPPVKERRYYTHFIFRESAYFDGSRSVREIYSARKNMQKKKNI